MKPLLLLFIGAYTAGSINFSILLFRILKKEDPRKEFSGNAGVTNVYRQAGYLWASVVLLMDLARAMGIALISTSLLRMELVPWVGLGLILGNRFPCFHNFHGGRRATRRRHCRGVLGVHLCIFSHPFHWIFLDGFHLGRRNAARL
jgi:glycerol-3-phosphate acyltransferase PlsY